MSINMKTITQAWSKASAAIEKTVHSTVQEVTGLPKPLQDYDLLNQIGSAGPGLAWKLYNAKSRDGHFVYPTVCVWVLDKKELSEARQRAGLSKAAEDAFLDILRADASRLVRLRHPGVVHVVQALDESKNAMAMVTEPLFASAANALGRLENIAEVPKELKGMEMGLLEIKHGLLQIAETLDFLHNNARLVHRALSPAAILITSNGAWKLGGFGFATSTDQLSNDSSNVQAFHYTEYDTEDSVLPLQPSLDYTAPELVRSKSSPVGCASDVFSLACVAYHLIARNPLFDCRNNVKMYMNKLTYLSSEAFSIPSELVMDLQKMLSTNEALRPTAMDFTGSPFFRDDTRLRALRFLDHMLERDNIQKSEFLKALSDMWKDFDSRVLRYKVLPPLCAELRNLVMQPMILPMVLTIAESQDKNDFEQSTLPALIPVLNSASGDTLLLLVKHAELIINKASLEHLISHVLPMLVRAYDDTDTRLQEEVLKKTVSLAKQLDVQTVKQAILPRVHGLALKTTVAAVRVNALVCLGDMVGMLDKNAVVEILQTIQRCTAVDRSSPTLMCTLGVSNSILKQYGIEFVAEHVLPLLVPLLLTQQLNVQQFAKYMHFVKLILRNIEEKRGVTLTDNGIPETKPILVADSNVVVGQINKTTSIPSSGMKHSASWDEDWNPNGQSSNSMKSLVSKPSSQSNPSLLNQSKQQITPNDPVPSQQSSSISPAVDVEWPPRSSSLSSYTKSDKSVGDFNGSKVASDSNFDSIDPFANWPPRSSGTTTISGSSRNDTVHSSSSWAFNSSTQNSMVPTRQNQEVSSVNSTSVGNGFTTQNSLGFMKQNPDAVVVETKADLGSIFSSSKNEQSAPRLAPPPTSAVGGGRGRGRGRGRGNQSQLNNNNNTSSVPKSSHMKQSGQRPLLDLL